MPRWATVIGVIGALCLSAAAVAQEIIERSDADNLWGLSFALLVIGTPLFLLTVIAAHVRQEALVPWLSRIASLVVLLGLLLGGEFARGYTFLGLPLAVLGAVLFGLAAFRAEIFPPQPPWLLMIAVPALALGAIVAESSLVLTVTVRSIHSRLSGSHARRHANRRVKYLACAAVRTRG